MQIRIYKDQAHSIRIRWQLCIWDQNHSKNMYINAEIKYGSQAGMTSHLPGPCPEQQDTADQALRKKTNINNTGLYQAGAF